MKTSNESQRWKYFEHTKRFYEFQLLARLDELRQISLPLESTDLNLATLLQRITIHELIEKDFIQKLIEGENHKLVLTKNGAVGLKKHYIDYQLELIALQKHSELFFRDLVSRIKQFGCENIALYGASDTTLSFFKYFADNDLHVQCIIDDDVSKHGNKVNGVDVVDASRLPNYPVDSVIISTIEYQEELFVKASESFQGKYHVYRLFY